MELIEGVALSKLCDYSFGDQSGQWGNIYTSFMKGANLLNYHSLLVCSGIHKEEIQKKGVTEVSKEYEAIVNFTQTELKW